MFKKIMLSVLVILVLYSGVLVVYKIFEPEPVTIAPSATADAFRIEYGGLKDYTLNSGDSITHYYFFCAVENPDCIYVNDTVMKTAEKEVNLDLNTIIEYVDVTSLEEKMDTSTLKNEWGISSYPALLSCSVNDGVITINNLMEWDANNPMDSADIVEWLELNDLYVNPNSEETIIQPGT